MSEQYHYNYAQIDLETGECFGVRTRTSEIINPALIPIEVDSNDYIGKYYNQANGKWYEDAAFTIEWPEPTA